MANVQVRTYGARLVARHIEGVARAAENLRPAEPAVARRVAEGYGRSFDRQGPGWSPLKPSTVRRRIGEGYSAGPILQKTGRYRKAATNPDALIVDYVGDGFEISVKDPKSAFHQSGTKKMVARPLKLSFGDRSALIRVLSDHIIGGYYGRA
jgi:hypothetical protein